MVHALGVVLVLGLAPLSIACGLIATVPLIVATPIMVRKGWQGSAACP